MIGHSGIAEGTAVIARILPVLDAETCVEALVECAG